MRLPESLVILCALRQELGRSCQGKKGVVAFLELLQASPCSLFGLIDAVDLHAMA
jgi:hypothetical protein